MNIKQILEQLQLIELKREEMELGQQIDAKDFPEAVQRIYELYKQGTLNVYCPDVFEFKYTGHMYALCAVSGKRNKNNLITYGIGLSLSKHSGQIVDGQQITEEMLIKAMKNTQTALFSCLNKHKIIFNSMSNTILFEHGGYVYALGVPKDNTEVCFLQTVFKADHQYMKRLKRRYK